MKIERADRDKTGWDRKLFIENADVYISVLESGLDKAPAEADGLCSIFAKRSVTPGARVLDVSCGIGRHSIELAKRGFSVVGFDPSNAFILRARELAKNNGLTKDCVRFYHGDILDIVTILSRSGEQGFSAIIDMDTSFGYGEPENDVQLFSALGQLGAKDSILVVQTINKDFWIKHRPRDDFVERFAKGLERRSMGFQLDKKSGDWTGRWVYYRVKQSEPSEELLSLNIKTRLYSESELIRLLGSTGWQAEATFSDIFSLKEESEDSKEFVLVCRKL